MWPESGVPWYLADGYPEGYYFDTYAADPKLARERIGRVIGSESLLLTGTVDLIRIQRAYAAGVDALRTLDGVMSVITDDVGRV